MLNAVTVLYRGVSETCIYTERVYVLLPTVLPVFNRYVIKTEYKFTVFFPTEFPPTSKSPMRTIVFSTSWKYSLQSCVLWKNRDVNSDKTLKKNERTLFMFIRQDYTSLFY
jgi:hypothetical protein